MIARAIVIGMLGTAAVFALFAIIAALPIIIIFSIITGIAYVVIKENVQQQRDNKLPRGPP